MVFPVSLWVTGINSLSFCVYCFSFMHKAHSSCHFWSDEQLSPLHTFFRPHNWNLCWQPVTTSDDEKGIFFSFPSISIALKTFHTLFLTKDFKNPDWSDTEAISLLMWVFLQLDVFEGCFLLLLLSLVLCLNKLVFSLGEGHGQNVGGCVSLQSL